MTDFDVVEPRRLGGVFVGQRFEVVLLRYDQLLGALVSSWADSGVVLPEILIPESLMSGEEQSYLKQLFLENSQEKLLVEIVSFDANSLANGKLCQTGDEVTRSSVFEKLSQPLNSFKPAVSPDDAKVKTLFLSVEKVRHLIGASGRNKLFLENEFNVKIVVPPKPKHGKSEDPIAVTVVAEGSETFATFKWAQNLQRYLKSATRGGFLKWAEDENEKNSALVDDPKLFERTEQRFNVKVVNHWDRKWSLWVVLEGEGCPPGHLEKAVQEAGEIMHNRFHLKKAKILAGKKDVKGAGARWKEEIAFRSGHVRK